MTQSLLETGKNGLLIACLNLDQSIGMQTGLRERRHKEITPSDHPEHLAAGAGGDTGRK